MKGVLMILANIKATAEGGKTLTRRVEACLRGINKEPDKWYQPVIAVRDLGKIKKGDFVFQHIDGHLADIRPRCQVGETVYLKESHCIECYKRDGIRDACYKYDEDDFTENLIDCDNKKWRSPLHMPEWAARYFIKIKDVRPERLQEITSEDCIHEGIEPSQFSRVAGMPIDKPSNQLIGEFIALWDSINTKRGYGWDVNPWIIRYKYLPVIPYNIIKGK